MTATVAASKAYDLSGATTREDLSDAIYDLSPMDTLFLTRAGRGTATSTSHEWLIDSLTAASSSNAQIEGDAFSAAARTPPSRLKNYTQISKKDFEVTRTANKVNNAGMKTLLAYHGARAMKEIKRDLETAMLANNPASAGTSVSARVSAGVPNWLHSSAHVKVNQSGGATTAPVSGFATATITDGTATALTETGLKLILAEAWKNGGEDNQIFVGSSLFNTVSNFTGLATRFRNVESKSQAQIIGSADVYVSPYGTHSIVLSRYMPNSSVYALDMSTWQVDYLDPFQVVDIAKVGDAERRQVIVEWTLVCKQPNANAKGNNVV